MRRGRRLPQLELSGEQRITLQGWTRRRKTAGAFHAGTDRIACLRGTDGYGHRD